MRSKVAVLAGGYYGAAKLGLSLAFAAPSVTAIWPPTGIALAAILLWGYRVWPGVALGALLANAWTGVPFYAVLGITVGNTLEALAGAYLLRELADFRPSLDRVRDVLALAVLAAAVSTTISATIGVTSLLVGNEIASGDLGSVWRTWWLGDMGGDLVVAPALLVAATHWPYRRAPGRPAEAVALAAAVLGVSALVFSQSTALTFLVLPLLVWAALRFWQPGAVGTTLLVASIAIPLTENDIGPFSGHPPDDRLLLAQGFLGSPASPALVLAAVITERRRAEETAEHIAETLQESLLPSHLPVIPGIETAVDFRAAGKQHLWEATSTTCSSAMTGAGPWWSVTFSAREHRGGHHRARPLHVARRGGLRKPAEPHPGAVERRDPAPVSRPVLHGGLWAARGRRSGRRPGDPVGWRAPVAPPAAR